MSNASLCFSALLEVKRGEIHLRAALKQVRASREVPPDVVEMLEAAITTVEQAGKMLCRVVKESEMKEERLKVGNTPGGDCHV